MSSKRPSLVIGEAAPRRPGRVAARLSFETDGRDWPHRDRSRFVNAGGLTWHVQVSGSGPAVLLVHGTGASTHSFAALSTLLAARFTVVAIDLPGHGFTGPLSPGGTTLPAVAAAVTALCRAMRIEPALAVGHSAGAAILIRMVLDGGIRPAAVISLNGALSGFRGVVGRAFSPLAKLLALNPLVPRYFARRAADPAVLGRLVGQTGSRVPAESVALYGRLARDPDHVGAALAMMAGWDLAPLRHDMRRLRTPVLLVAGGRDGMVPPEQAFEAAGRLPVAEVVLLRQRGHLAHEEEPAEVAALIVDAARRHGVLPEDAP